MLKQVMANTIVEDIPPHIVTLGHGFTIPKKDLEIIYEQLQKFHETRKYNQLARTLMNYYFGNEDSIFWKNSTTNLEIKKKLALARDAINRFVLNETGHAVKRILEDMCCQRRKYIKQQIERAQLKHVCRKCNRRCKSACHKRSHEKCCNLPLLNIASKKKSRLEAKNDIIKQKSKLDKKVRNKYQMGLEMRLVENKSRGVFALRKFRVGDYVCCYPGTLMSGVEAKKLEKLYCKDGKGCYLYFFQFKSKKMCFDATEESEQLGRLINHSRTSPNLMSKVLTIDDRPVIVFFAKRIIQRCEEVTYDYGERSSAAVSHFKWLGK